MERQRIAGLVAPGFLCLLRDCEPHTRHQPITETMLNHTSAIQFGLRPPHSHIFTILSISYRSDFAFHIQPRTSHRLVPFALIKLYLITSLAIDPSFKHNVFSRGRDRNPVHPYIIQYEIRVFTFFR